jgi:photosynthetic reaction center H subunit
VTVPMAMAQVNQRLGKIRVDAIRSDQFDAAPALASTSQITRLEEEKVVGYFGGGYLYAKRSRIEPFL